MRRVAVGRMNTAAIWRYPGIKLLSPHSSSYIWTTPIFVLLRFPLHSNFLNWKILFFLLNRRLLREEPWWWWWFQPVKSIGLMRVRNDSDYTGRTQRGRLVATPAARFFRGDAHHYAQGPGGRHETFPPAEEFVSPPALDDPNSRPISCNCCVTWQRLSVRSFFQWKTCHWQSAGLVGGAVSDITPFADDEQST